MTIVEILQKIEIFKTLPENALAELAGRLKPRTLRAGEVLFEQGAPGDELIIVKEGKIGIYTPEDGHPEAGQVFRTFQTGQFLGEMALIDHKPRSTGARAETESTILTLDSESFLHLLGDYPQVGLDVTSGLSSRLRYTTDFLGEVKRCVGLMAKGDYQSIRINSDLQDDNLATLAADFVRMAAQVQEREEKLRQEVAQLRIEIDEKKRKDDFSQITGSDYYQDLKAKLKALREQEDD